MWYENKGGHLVMTIQNFNETLDLMVNKIILIHRRDVVDSNLVRIAVRSMVGSKL